MVSVKVNRMCCPRLLESRLQWWLDSDLRFVSVSVLLIVSGVLKHRYRRRISLLMCSPLGSLVLRSTMFRCVCRVGKAGLLLNSEIALVLVGTRLATSDSVAAPLVLPMLSSESSLFLWTLRLSFVSVRTVLQCPRMLRRVVSILTDTVRFCLPDGVSAECGCGYDDRLLLVVCGDRR